MGEQINTWTPQPVPDCIHKRLESKSSKALSILGLKEKDMHHHHKEPIALKAIDLF